jgi:hypothetical protein
VESALPFSRLMFCDGSSTKRALDIVFPNMVPELKQFQRHETIRMTEFAENKFEDIVEILCLLHSHRCAFGFLVLSSGANGNDA